MESILITGGAGFIGSHLVDALIDKGYDVHIIDDLSMGKEKNINPRSTFHKIQIQDKRVEEIFKKINFIYVFHLAAQADVRRSCSDPMYDANSNIMGTLNILSLSRKYGLKKFIFSSSGGVIYGDVKTAATETSPAQPISPYGISKFSDELYIIFFRKFFPYTILRYANVYGERQDPSGEAGVVSIFTKNMLNGEPCTLYGYGKPQRDYIYVRDVVKANILSLQRGDNEILNIGTGVATTVEELYSHLQKITDYDIAPVYKPLREGELKSNYLCIKNAKNVLGWEPSIQLQEGLKKVAKWLRVNDK